MALIANLFRLYYAVDTALHFGDGSHDVNRLILDSNGFKLDKQLNSLLLGSGSAAGGTTGYDQPVTACESRGDTGLIRGGIWADNHSCAGGSGFFGRGTHNKPCDG